MLKDEPIDVQFQPTDADWQTKKFHEMTKNSIME